jgi:hypothetical protein
MQKKNKIANPFSDDGTAAVIAAAPTFAIAEMLFHVNPVAGGILAAGAGMVGWRHWEEALAALDAFFNWKDAPARSASKLHQDEPVQRDEKGNAQPEKPKEGIILGNDKFGRPVARELKQLKNILILGLPGQGKSSLATWLLSQMAVNYGARFIIVDRHARDDESLAAMLSPFEKSFLRPPAYKFEDIQASIEYATDILNQRMEGDDEDRQPVIFVVDEFTNLMTSKKITGITDTVEAYNAMGRKYGCFSLCIGQLVNASRTGGTEIRSLFATKMLLGMEKSQAQMIVDGSAAAQAERLQPGECIVKGEGREAPFKIKFPKKSQKYYKEQVRNLIDQARPLEPQTDQMPSVQAQNDSDLFIRPLEDQQSTQKIDNNAVGAGLKDTSLRDIIARYKAGESVRSIGANYGVTSGDDRKALKQMLDSLVEPVMDIEE